jgi:hypothetical protein
LVIKVKTCVAGSLTSWLSMQPVIVSEQPTASAALAQGMARGIAHVQ